MFIYILLPILFIVASVFLFMNFAPQIGGSSKGDRMKRIENSPQYKDGKFVNQIETNMNTGEESMFKTMMKFFKGVDNSSPRDPLVTEPVNRVFSSDKKGLQMMWFGHSTLLAQFDGVKFITDPVFSERTSPVSFAGTKAFDYMPKYNLEDLPEIDYVLITHDHYDHLDYKSINFLKDKVKTFVVPLGVAAHLIHWGIIEEKIIELDWHEHVVLSGVKVTMTPSRHFSGRGLTNRNSTLWCSYVVEKDSNKVYFSGDSGYGPHFKEIGEQYGPFDYCFMECGQYNKSWANIHMMPEETAQAFVDLKGTHLIPIHWAKFALSLHSWTEPIERLSKKADELKVSVNLPPVGAVIDDESIVGFSEKWYL